jgi:hypothetical protein
VPNDVQKQAILRTWNELNLHTANETEEYRK